MKMQPAEGSLGKAITIRRVEMGLSRNELRDRCGLSYPYLAELEKGLKSPSSRALEAIAQALEMRPHELMARAEALADAQDQTSPPELTGAGEGPRRWFGPASAPDIDAAGATAARPLRARSSTGPAPPLNEERVREIVREELRRLLSEAAH